MAFMFGILAKANLKFRVKFLFRIFCFVFVVSILTLNLVFAAGSTSANFLKIAPGARPAGIGEAFTSIANDASAIYYNSAGLSTLKSKELVLSHSIWFQDIQHSFFAFTLPVGVDYFTNSPNKAIGFSATYLGIDGLERRTSNTPEPQGSFGAGDFSFAAAYSHSFQDLVSFPFSAGTSVKIIRQTIDTYSADAVAVDFGLLCPFSVNQTPFTLGFTVQNLGTPIKFLNESYPLPLTYKCGISFCPPIDKGIPLRVAFDVSLPNDNDLNWRVGTEYIATRLFALRLGYNNQNQMTKDALTGKNLGSINDEVVAKFTGFMAGIGFNVPLNRVMNTSNILNIDYAFVPYGDLGNTHRISLGLKW